MSTGLALTNDDRRIKTRFDAPCLDVHVRRRGLLGWRSEPVQVECININRYGIAVQSGSALGVGARVLMDFSGKYIKQSHVCAKVVSEVPYEDGYRIGIQFSYCMDHRVYSRHIDNALSRIEGLYRQRRHQS